MSAALGIVHNIVNNKQKFLGGYEVKSDNDQHDDDIISIDYSSSSVQMVATGQRGIKPKIIVWSPSDPKIIYLTLYQTKGTKEVSSLGFSRKGTYLGSIGKDPQKTFFVFNLQTKDCIWSSTVGTDIIFDLKFSSIDENEFCMVGMNNVYFANIKDKTLRKGNYFEQKPTNHTCIQYLPDGTCITSTTIGSIYFWNKSHDCYKSLKLSESTLHSLKISPLTKKIYTGDAKNNLYIINNFTLENTITVSSCVKAIDINSKGELILGLREGTIMLKNLETEEDSIVNMSHNDGEVWGLEYVPDKYVLTTGDDNKIILWDLTNFKNESIGKINEIPGTRKNISGSSSITEFPANQCARSVTYNPKLDHVAIGICDGSLSIRNGLLNLNERLFEDIQISKEWIEVMKYSPNYKYLAVGCHDKVIYILDSNENYAKLKTLRDHSSFIRCLDWDIENQFIQSVCGNREYLFFDVREGKQERSNVI